MFANLLTVFEQVLVLFCLIGVGFLCAKAGLAKQSAVTTMSNLVLYASIPCTLLSAFQLDMSSERLHDFLAAALCAAGIYAVSFLAAHLLVRDRDPYRKHLMTLGSLVSNCNFMGFPLQTAVLGSMGVFYGSAYAAITPLFVWTVGVVYLNGGTKDFSLKKALLNPGVLGSAAGLALMAFQITLPPLPNRVITYLADLAVPLPMLIVGVQLANTDLRQVIREKTVWLVGLLRLIVFPLAALGVLYLCGVRGSVLVATIIAAAAPPAVLVAMFDRPGSTLGSGLVSLHTLCSIVTMPVIVSLSQTLSQLP